MNTFGDAILKELMGKKHHGDFGFDSALSAGEHVYADNTAAVVSLSINYVLYHLF